MAEYTPTTGHLELTLHDAIYGYNDGIHAMIGLGNISDDIQVLSIRRGRAHVLDRIEAGTLNVRVKNIEGYYWTNNEASPFYPNVRPQAVIKVRRTYSGITYTVYTGLVEEISLSFAMPPIKLPVADFGCSDIIANLAQLKLNGVGYSQEKSGVRIGHVLDDLQWESSQRDIATGDFNVPTTGTLVDENSLEHIDAVRLAEGGLFFIGGEGKVYFQDQSYRSGLSSQATFGDQAGDMKFHRVELNYDSFNIYNEIRLKREGGSQQLALDDESIALYGKRVYLKEDFLLTSDAEVMQRTQQMLTKYKSPRLRVQKLTIRPDADPANLFPMVLGFDISTMITVRLTEADIFERYHIEGIQHNWDARADLWETIWDLSPVVTYELILSTVSLEVQGYAPSINVGRIPAAAHLEVQGYAPDVVGWATIIEPTTGSLEVTGYVPTVTNQP